MDGGQKAEVGKRKTDVRREKSEVGRQKSDVGDCQKTEIDRHTYNSKLAARI